jgi:hypothetical protein
MFYFNSFPSLAFPLDRVSDSATRPHPRFNRQS